MAPPSPQFQTTLWSQVILAASEPDTEVGRRALARLCDAYWYPIYAFIRRRGTQPEDAKDLTQGFFEHILGSDFLVRADPERGRFRSFLLGAVRNHLGSEWERRMAQRRGGRVEKVPIDASIAEDWLAADASAGNDPTRAFDRAWAMTVVNTAIGILEGEQAKAGRGHVFSTLREFLQRAPNSGEYETVAARLGMNRGAVAAAVHRLTERFGEVVRRLVRETVADPELADDEVRFLVEALRS